MESLVFFFAKLNVWQKAGILLIEFVFFWSLESAFGVFKTGKYKHAKINLFFWVWTLAINLIFAGLITGASVFVEKYRLGLLYLFELPFYLKIIFSFILTDLIAVYFHHRLAHRIPAFWKLHIVHHSDTRMDFTTSLRHHPLEALIRVGFTVLAVILVGVPTESLVLYQAITFLFSQWIHSDSVLPEFWERTISKIFITPGLHKVHHHKTLPWTDSNYGTVFSFWDRIFGTIRFKSEIEFGVDVLPDSEEREKSPIRLLLLPFRAEKEGYIDKSKSNTNIVAWNPKENIQNS
ncbi:sterol desaturase family protein [Leptospira neocaledonica]|uniref:Fatty acid hydroxylase domain-containing protein n=1 Tax=Leptospira neocaledonica TaxID=2023192 RepID=A0A2M9ZWM5_9LEPT|nr:sterol desaturase family protein [Leptospira neocaledonica]PJZ76456.1 hypothetical protein CH365_13815 [Leptospira neocaledonica]